MQRAKGGKYSKIRDRYFYYGLRYERSEFVSLIHNEERKSYKFTEEESIAMVGIMEKFMETRK